MRVGLQILVQLVIYVMIVFLWIKLHRENNIIIANRLYLKALEPCKILLHIKISNKKTNFILMDGLFFYLDTEKNLLSIKKAIEKSWIVTFEKNNCKLMHDEETSWRYIEK